MGQHATLWWIVTVVPGLVWAGAMGAWVELVWFGGPRREGDTKT